LPRLRPIRRRNTTHLTPAVALPAAAGGGLSAPSLGMQASQAAPEARQPRALGGTRGGASGVLRSDGDSSNSRSWAGRVNRAAAVLRYHWLATLLIVAGTVLRVITWMAYHPAIFYIDSIKYLYHGWQGSDPLGYKIPLKIVLAFGDLGTVTALQHLIGLGIGVALYVLLIRRGINRWLSALAIAPILLDAYQLQAEATIMPDVLFEGMAVAALVILLWKPTATWVMILVSGLILGLGATVREVGLWMIAPAVLYLLVSRWLRLSRDDWYSAVLKSCVISLAFLLPIVAYCSISYVDSGHFRLSVKGSAAGRMAEAVDCATIKLPADVRPLCPTVAEQKTYGPDWFDSSKQSPLVRYKNGTKVNLKTVSVFDHAVERQQPLRVIGSVLKDSIRLFELSRNATHQITPISRWQFQHYLPSYNPEFVVCGSTIAKYTPHVAPDGKVVPGLGPLCGTASKVGRIIVGVQATHSSPVQEQLLNPAYGGKAEVDGPLASFLRDYQLYGGFTPGPLLLIFTILGLVGSVLALVYRSGSPWARHLALASLAFFITGLGLLLIGDLYVFTWRYQLQALISLPPAGVLGAAAAFEALRYRRRATQSAPEIESTTAATAPAT
jgi:hypothetical protein